MIAFLADEDFNNNIINGILRRNASLDIVRVQTLDMRGAEDPTVLEWAARNRRVVLTRVSDLKPQPIACGAAS